MRTTFRSFCAASSILVGSLPLEKHDPEMHALIQKEYTRQRSTIELIASENFTSRSVLECLGSVLTNKYAEGYPGKRYYGGTEVVDEIERLCRHRALEAFRLDPNQWGVNVQPYSGSSANFEVYSALLAPHDRIMGLHLLSGGHLTHGYYTPSRRVSASSLFFESLPYPADPEGYVDYVMLEKLANAYLPKLIIAGASAYPRDWDYATFRRICDQVGAYLMVDMSHISGLVAAQEQKDPFLFADIVTSTTHKTLRGPRSGLIFFRRKVQAKNGRVVHLEDRINRAVFPLLQGGPHVHQIAAVATQLKEVNSVEFKAYALQVKKNAHALANALLEDHQKLITGGTDNHLLLWDLRPHGITGETLEKLLEMANVAVNKNTIVGDQGANASGGIRLGTPAITTRGFLEKDMIEVASILTDSLNIAKRLVNVCDTTNKKSFVDQCKEDSAFQALKERARSLAERFPFPSPQNIAA